MTYAPLKHLHTKFRVIFPPLKQEYSFLIFLKTTVNSSKTVALGLVSSHLHEALPFHDSYQHFNFHKRSSLLEWGKKKMAVVAVCLAGTRGVHRCYRCPPRGSDKAVYFSPFHYFFIWFFLSSAQEPCLVVDVSACSSLIKAQEWFSRSIYHWLAFHVRRKRGKHSQKRVGKTK